MINRAFLVAGGLIAVAAAANSQEASNCESLSEHFSRYDAAAMFFDRSSRSESSTLRAETAQSALTNILLRQGMVLDMMIAQGCDLPAPPEFPLLGLIRGNN